MTLSIRTQLKAVMFRFLAVIVVVHSVNCAFFDLTDIDDPLSLLWHTKDSIGTSKLSSKCHVQNDHHGGTWGECKHKFHCLLSGGQPQGQRDCGVLSTCCTYGNLCYKNTKAKESYFTGNLSNREDCYFVVEALNDNICQVRLDFIDFLLRGPQDVPVDSKYSVQCMMDYLSIDPLTYNIPHRICGYNTGQHIYIHMHSSRKVKLHIHLSSRTPADTTNTNHVLYPHWNIKVTQLECPGIQNFFSKYTNSSSARDFPLLAPEGAIQYFLEPHGIIRSFGFNGVSQYEYTSGLHYGIAFRKAPHMNCMRFTPNYIKLMTTSPNPWTCRDYLFIPELHINGTRNDPSKYCPMKTASNVPFSGYTPGPFYIHFISQKQHSNPMQIMEPLAFDITYDLLSCPDLTD